MKRTFGGTGFDDSDSDEYEEEDPSFADKSPNTKKRVKDEKLKKKIKKLGACETYITLLKGFVCTSVLYLPKSFVNGGWGFQAISLLISMSISIVCCNLLLDTKKEVKASSYTEIGLKTYGNLGKHAANLFISLS